MRKSIFFLVISVVVLSCESHKKNQEENIDLNTKNEIDIKNTINNVYNNIVVESNKKPDFIAIKEQFTSNARLGYLKNDSLILKTPNQYFDNMKDMLTKNEVKYLKEWEIQGETKQFGNIAQRTSLYGVHFNTKDSLAEKGIINFQLVKTKGKWQILSMIWQAENKDLKVSNNYFD